MTVKDFRLSLGMTQVAFAQLLGCTSVYLSLIERGHRQPSVDLALEIERLSRGAVDAAQICRQVARVRVAH
jgi:transcriptional regulator with XRE-family HTH domain